MCTTAHPILYHGRYTVDRDIFIVNTFVSVPYDDENKKKTLIFMNTEHDQ